MRKLPTFERKVLQATVVDLCKKDPLGQQSVARTLGLSQQAISRLVRYEVAGEVLREAILKYVGSDIGTLAAKYGITPDTDEMPTIDKISPVVARVAEANGFLPITIQQLELFFRASRLSAEAWELEKAGQQYDRVNRQIEADRKYNK